MKKRLFKFIMLFAILVSLTTLVSCLKSDKADFTKIKVVLLKTDGVNILSKQTMEIKPGNDVTFNVKIADEYAYLGMTKNGVPVREEEGVPAKDFPIEGEYNEKSGYIKLKAVKYPTTVEIITKPKADLYSFELVYNNRQGGAAILDGVKLTKGYKWMPQTDGKLKLSAYANENYTFNGWSVGDYIENGGKIVSYEKEIEYLVEDNTVLYANFSDFGINNYKVVYHGNGGKVALEGKDNGKSEYEVLGEYNTQFPMQQTLHSNGTFVRDGYVAIGYSTQKVNNYENYESVNNIAGFTNMGGVCKIPASNVLPLYVVWAKETPASDFVFSNGKITAYKGNGSVVVIPEKIGGVKVTEIAAGAFKDKTTIARLVIPKSVNMIRSGAFENCTGITDVVFFDSVLTVTDDAFKGCNKISTITLNSQRLPKYSGTAEGTFCVKYERLRTLNGKKLIFVSGASGLHSINSKTIEKAFSGYSVLNYGTNENTSLLFYLDVIDNYIGKDDIVVHSPEFNKSLAMGDNTITPKLFRANEQCYDIFREVDMTKYTGFWTAFGRFQKGDPNDTGFIPAIHRDGKEYQLPCADINAYGDWNQSKDAPTADSFGSATQLLDTSILSYANLNAINAEIVKKGGKLLMSFAARDRETLSPLVANQNEFDKFTRYCEDKLDYPIISNIGQYMIEHAYFWDSENHCNDDGAIFVTERLIENLRRYLNVTNYPGAPMFASQLTIVYNANGGAVTATGGNLFEVGYEHSDQFSMQQTLWSNGTFIRNGYVAIGYSTSKGATFEGYANVNAIPGFSNLGGVCEVPKSNENGGGLLYLYVVWAKETASTDFTFSDGVITKYKGNAEIVVIPEYINGVKVTRVAKDAFKGNTTLKRLVLPKSLISLDDYSFENCTNLSEVVFFDSLINVTDNAFRGSSKISTITLNSQRLPVYSGGGEGTFCIKYMRVRTNRDNKKIVVVSGSSTMHALNSPVMEQNFPGYKVINYGTNISGSSLFYMDAISKYVTEGDVIIHAPEMSSMVMGSNEINPKLFRGNEQCYDIFREVDMTNYTSFWTAFGLFQNGDPAQNLSAAKNMTGVQYQKPCGTLNMYGDFIHSKGDWPKVESFGGATAGISKDILSTANVARLNALNVKIKARGGHLVMSFAARDISRMNPNAITAAKCNDYTTDCENKLDYAVISNIGDYFFAHSDYYDSEWHTNDTGRDRRTALLTRDLNRYLSWVKNPSGEFRAPTVQ